MSIASFLSGLAALTVLILLGFFVVSLLWPPQVSRRLIWAFAPAVGAGICSLIFICFRRPMFTIEFALLLALGAAYFFVRKPMFEWRSLIQPLPANCIL